MQLSLYDDMMERAEWGPDVCLYIGPDKGTGQDTRQTTCTLSRTPHPIVIRTIYTVCKAKKRTTVSDGTMVCYMVPEGLMLTDHAEGNSVHLP